MRLQITVSIENFQLVNLINLGIKMTKENFEEGKIYRMSAKGEVEKDGSIPIDEDDIDPMDRCLEITVDVVDWAVELVYPEF